MSESTAALARRILEQDGTSLTRTERRVLERITARQQISHDVSAVYDEQLSFGQRVADKVAEFGGSWTFILCFAGVLVFWVVLNTVLLARGAIFDPYPFILLNLFLSMLAAIQAPIIMMSQNRQAAKDRLAAAHDYEVNLKAEIEILALHDKLDQLRAHDLTELLHRLERLETGQS